MTAGYKQLMNFIGDGIKSGNNQAMRKFTQSILDKNKKDGIFG